MAALTLADVLAKAQQNAGGVGWLDADPCVYCLRRPDELPDRGPLKARMTLEHIVPRSRLGATKVPKGWGRSERGWENHARACSRCNSRRGDVPFIRWLVEEAARLGPSPTHPFRPGWPGMGGRGWQLSKSP